MSSIKYCVLQGSGKTELQRDRPIWLAESFWTPEGKEDRAPILKAGHLTAGCLCRQNLLVFRYGWVSGVVVNKIHTYLPPLNTIHETQLASH